MLGAHANPVFGASKIIEHEIAAINALKTIGFIRDDIDEFGLVEKLRITKSKARSLLYQMALRTEDDADAINAQIKATILTPRIEKQGELFLIEVPHPLTMDRLRQRVRQLGFLSDGSFSGSVARISEKALIALLADLLSEEERQRLMGSYHAQGVSDKTPVGIIKNILAKALQAAVGQAGAEFGSTVFNALKDVFNHTP